MEVNPIVLYGAYSQVDWQSQSALKQDIFPQNACFSRQQYLQICPYFYLLSRNSSLETKDTLE